MERRVAFVAGRAVVEAAAQPGAGFEEDDPEAAVGRRERRRHAGRAAADHADIRLGEDVGVGSLHLEIRGDLPESGGLADLLHGHGPYPRGLVEGLVIKTRGHHPVEFVHEAHVIEVGRAHDILLLDLHPVFERQGFRPLIGNPVDLHHGVAAFAVEAVEPPRAMVFQASGKDPDAVCIQGRRHRIALDPLEDLTLVTQGQLLGRVDPQCRQCIEPVHSFASGASTSRLVTVLRWVVNQAPHPSR